MNDYIIDIQYITTNESEDRNESGHLSGHSCPDKTKNNGINGQSGQNTVGDSDGVRYNANDFNEIKHDNGHFNGHVH